MLTSLLGFAYFITGYVVKKHDEVRVIRASLKTPPHTVGSNCLMGGESIAILKRYLDNSDHWVYDVMVLDDESMMAKNSIIHKSIKYCEE
jgi:hypothetical protein